MDLKQFLSSQSTSRITNYRHMHTTFIKGVKSLGAMSVRDAIASVPLVDLPVM